ncbi:MAG: hypothetical protein R3E87_02715 [Burkholderiaceae bacterium]
MDAASGFSTISQIATAVLGFSGLVTVFDHRPVANWSRVDRIRLFFLIGSTATPLLASLLAMIVLTIGMSPDFETVALSILVMLILGPWWIAGTKKVVSVSREELVAEGWSPGLFWVLQGLLLVLLILQVANFTGFSWYWVPLASVTCQLLTAVMQFVRFVVTRRAAAPQMGGAE